MQGEIYIYIASIFGLIFYIADFNSIYKIHKTIYILEISNENNEINLYSIKMRICSLCANGCILSFNIINDFKIPIYSSSLFLSLDFILLILRIIYLYLHNYHKRNQSIIITNVLNPINV